MDYPSEAEILQKLPSVEELVFELTGSQDVSSEALRQAIRTCEDESRTFAEQGCGYDSIICLAKRTKLQAYVDQSAAPMDEILLPVDDGEALVNYDVANDSDTTLPQTDDIAQTDVLSQTRDPAALPQGDLKAAESSGALLRRLTDEKEAWQKQLSEMKEAMDAQDTKMEEDKKKRREKIDEMVDKSRDAGMIVPVMKNAARLVPGTAQVIPPKAVTITGTQQNGQPTAATIPTVTGRTRGVWAANSGFHSRRAKAVAKTMPTMMQTMTQQRCLAAPSYTGGGMTRYRGGGGSFSANTQQFMASGNTQQFMVDSMGRVVGTAAPRNTSGYSTPMPGGGSALYPGGGSALYAVGGTPSAASTYSLMSSQRNVSALPVAPSQPSIGGVSLMSSQRNISLMSSQKNVPIMSTQQNVPLMSTQQSVPRVPLMSSVPLMSGAMTPGPAFRQTPGMATYAPTNGYPRSSAPVVTQAMPMAAATINMGGAVPMAAYRAA